MTLLNSKTAITVLYSVSTDFIHFLFEQFDWDKIWYLKCKIHYYICSSYLITSFTSKSKYNIKKQSDNELFFLLPFKIVDFENTHMHIGRWFNKKWLIMNK